MSGVYSIIQDHGGTISVLSSAPNQGTTFEIKLPVSIVTRTIAKIDAATIPPKSKLKVLWVDDDQSITYLGKLKIETFGDTADTANSGHEALNLLNTNQYDLIITDIGMPGMNGWELSDHIRKKYGDSIPIAVVSGWDKNQLSQDIEKHHVNYVLEKPLKMKKLADLLNIILMNKANQT